MFRKRSNISVAAIPVVSQAKSLINKEAIIASVADGHGYDGHTVKTDQKKDWSAKQVSASVTAEIFCAACAEKIFHSIKDKIFDEFLKQESAQKFSGKNPITDIRQDNFPKTAINSLTASNLQNSQLDDLERTY